MANNDHEAVIVDLLRQSPSIPERQTTNVACCCGRPSCAYLIHNNDALECLEKNIHTAAKLGQVRIPKTMLLLLKIFRLNAVLLLRLFLILSCPLFMHVRR